MWLLLVLIIMPIDIDQYLNPNHEALFQATDRELIVYGGAGAGKSFSIADKLLLQRGFRQMPYRCLCVRKTLASVKKTTAWFLEQRAKTFGWDFDLNKSDWTARCGNGEFIFAGMNSKEDYQKIKSMTDIDFIWVNEAQEIRETDYNELLLRLRGQTLTEQYAFRQIICDFNPIGKFSWVYQRFFEKNIGNSKKLRYTVESNPWVDKEYIAALKSSADWDENYYRIFYLGEWGELEGLIFNWDVVPLPTDIAFDEISHGGDFGYSVDPAALVRLYRKADEFWVQLLLYERKLTNIQLGERMLSMGFTNRDITVWDSAEPKSIQELYNLGLNAIPARKGPDSVKHSYDLAKSLKIHIVESTDNYDSEPLIREVKGHVYKKDKDGNSTNEPIEINNHAIKAVLYALHTLYNNQPTDANRLRGGIALRHESLG